MVDPTFGYTTGGGSASGIYADRMYGSLHTSPSDAGTVTSMSVYAYQGFASGTKAKSTIVKHSDLTIVTNARSSETVIKYGGPATWNNFSFASNPELSSNTDYILMTISAGDYYYIHYDTGSTNQGHYDSTNSEYNPQDLGTASHNNNSYSIYATYTSTGSSTNPGTPATKDAFFISHTSAVLDASLDIKDATSTNLFFQYGLTTSYGSTSSIKTMFASSTSATSSISGLSASTTYHFRAVATSTNSGVPQYGQDKTFTTSSTPVSYPGQPTTKDAFNITDGSAILDASLDIRNATATNLFFQYGLTTSYGSTSSIRTLFASSTSATTPISGLTASTTYHFRALATSTNDGTPQYGQDKTFTTSPSTSGPDYLETYTHNAIGNILNKSDQGNYAYTDNGYNNPHAVTSINGITYFYDNNGNLTNDGTWTHTWDYNNRLATSTKTNTIITYSYDHEGNRVKYNTGSNTTIYPNQYYNTDGSKITKNIYANGQLIATIEGGKTYYVHTDHLTGSNVISNDEGGVVQLLDYYPYGGIRLDEQSGSFDEKKKAFGHEYDSDSGLYYMLARYQNPTIGRFTSIDPVFNDLGIDKKQFKEKYNKELIEILADPQEMNSYSYARNNPVRYIDPKGQTPLALIAVAAYALFEAGSSIYDIGNLAYTYINPKFTEQQRKEAAEFVALGLMIPGSGKMADDVLDLGRMGRSLSRINISGSRLQHVIDTHTLKGANFIAGKKSYFNEGVDIKGLINKASSFEGKLNDAGFYERTYDAGKNIGVDRITGKQTSVMTVITDKNHNLITAHPGSPGKAFNK